MCPKWLVGDVIRDDAAPCHHVGHIKTLMFGDILEDHEYHVLTLIEQKEAAPNRSCLRGCEGRLRCPTDQCLVPDAFLTRSQAAVLQIGKVIMRMQTYCTCRVIFHVEQVNVTLQAAASHTKA